MLSRTLRPVWVSTGLLLAFSLPGRALDFHHDGSGIDGLIDIEMAYGLRLRTQDQDEKLVSIAHGGRRPNSGDYDDGTLNYDEGDLVANMVRTTAEVTLSWLNLGAFIRGYAFYDYENEENDRDRTDLTAEALEQVGSDADVLDAYLSARFEYRDIPLLVRLGDQVVNWGESRHFATMGVNVANPVNLPLVQQPTGTLRDLRKPVGMLWTAAHLTPLFVVEAYYQYDWDKTVLPAGGTYFAPNDAITPGGRFLQTTGIYSQFGTDMVANLGIPAETLEAVGIPIFDPNYYQVDRRIDADRPGDHGQFGITLQSILPHFNDSKVALHFANYHNKTPFFSAITPGVDVYVAYSQQAIAALAQALLEEGVDAATAGAAAEQVQFDRLQNEGQYFLDYPENIRMLGLSFNSTSSRSGTAYYGEIAHHFDAPLPIHFGDLLPDILPGASRDIPLPPIDLETIDLVELASDYANQRIDTDLERDKTFAVAGASQFLGPQLGAAQSVVNLEMGYLRIWNMPAKSTLLLAEPGISAVESSPRGIFATANSWGYRIGGLLVYPNALGGLTLRPRLLWSHDVDGNSPLGAGPFREDRKSLRVGLQAEYIKRLRLDVSYTRFSGAGEWNLLNDRDNISVSLRYVF